MKNLHITTAEHLIYNLGISSRFINMMANSRSMQKVISIIGEELSYCQKLALMIQIEGPEFFAGSEKKELRKKGTVTMGAPGTILATSQFQLYTLPFFWGNNGFMAVFHIVLGNLTLIDLRFLL